MDRRLFGLGVVDGWGLGVAATVPLLQPPLLALALTPTVVMTLTLALVVVLVVARAPLRNFLKVMGGRPRPPVGAAGAVVVLAVLVMEEVACVV